VYTTYDCEIEKAFVITTLDIV